MANRKLVSSGSPYEPTIGFSRAVGIADRILVSGTGPVWPDGSCPDDAALQARRCFEIIAKALAEAGAQLSDVVRTRMFLTSTRDADSVSTVHGELFGAIRPAATMIVVAALLDDRWKIEIEAEAIVQTGKAEWLKPGAHVTSVGYMPTGSELDIRVLDLGRVFVETRTAFQAPPAGCPELAGRDPDAATELGELIIGAGRTNDSEGTVYKAMGHAIEDLVAAEIVYRRALQHPHGVYNRQYSPRRES